jgi:hypothetical protein
VPDTRHPCFAKRYPAGALFHEGHPQGNLIDFIEEAIASHFLSRNAAIYAGQLFLKKDHKIFDWLASASTAILPPLGVRLDARPI